MKTRPGVLKLSGELGTDEQSRRRKLGPLHRLALGASNRRKYSKAYRGFMVYARDYWGGLPRSLWELDDCVAEQIEEFWINGINKSWANYLVAAVQFYCKRSRGHLKNSWQLLKIWGRHETPIRAASISELFCLAICGLFTKWELPGALCAALLGFYGLLRMGECFKIRCGHVVIAPGGASAVVFLPNTKTSDKFDLFESVLISERYLVRLLGQMIFGKASSDPLIVMSHSQFRNYLGKAVCFLGGEDWHVTGHSFRRGGATAHFQRCARLDKTMHLGRWSSVKVAKLYIHDSLQALCDFKVSREQKVVMEVCKQWLRC